MFSAQVTLLHGSGGERLAPSQRAAPITGVLVISEIHRNREAKLPYTVTVDLWEQYGTTSQRGLAHMFDPRILPNDAGPGLLITGYQRSSSADVVREHRQAWLVVPLVG